MRIVIAGGSGFLGRALSLRLRTAGHDVVVLTRDGAQPRRRGSSDTESRAIRYTQWTPNGEAGDWSREIDGADAL